MENPLVDEGGLSERWSSQVLSVLRIITALLFLQHGMTKILAYPWSSASDPPMWSLLWVAGIIELFGSLLLLVGFLTRPVALLLCGEMAVGYFMVHAARGPFPMLNGGESAVLFCFIFLYLAFEGPGPWSVDERMRRRRKAEGPDSYYEGLRQPATE